MPRAILNAVISFGLVAIPVKVYTAAASDTVSFNMLTKNGNRVKQKLVDAITGEEVDRKDTLKGYEVTKDQYVSFTQEEIAALETPRDPAMVIKEFIDLDSIDFIRVEKSYYLGPDKGGDRGYTLLSQVLDRLNRVAVAQWNVRGKEQLVLVCPYKRGLVLHQLYYTTEIRDFDEIEIAKVQVSDAELDMAGKLVETLQIGSFKPSKYVDGYARRVQAAIDAKATGQPTTPNSTSTPTSKTLPDLLETLKRSISDAKNEKI